MMRSFGNRADTYVSDEPYYGAFLKASGAPHPMADAVIAAMDCDWRSVARTLAGPVPGGRPVWYQKHMWHHMVGPVGYADFAGFTHAFLIRDPARMIASYLRKREAAAFEDFGLERQADFFAREADRLGEAPPVIDAGDVLADPEATLRAFARAWGSPGRGYAALAAGPPRHRRPLGAALVSGGRGLDRLRPARSAARRSARRGPRPRRTLPLLYDRLAAHRLAARAAAVTDWAEREERRCGPARLSWRCC